MKTLLLALLSIVLLLPISSSAEEVKDIRDPPNATITPILGTQIDTNLTVTTIDGSKVPLKSLILPQKPALLMPVYFECPRLCGFIMNGVLDMLREQSLELGKDYTIITYSINPGETYDLAAKKRANYEKELKASKKEINGWNFVVADEATISTLSKSLGFNFVPEGENDYAHGAAVFVLTDKATISQYFTGVTYDPRDVRLALVDASQGKIGTPLDHITLLCSSFDPKTGKYNWVIARILQGLGTIMILFVGGIIVFYLVLERRKKKKFGLK